MTDEPLEAPEPVEASDDQSLGAPVTGEVPEQLPSWARVMRPTVRHPQWRSGVWSRTWAPTEARLAEFFPDAFDPATMPRVPSGGSGPDYGGKPPLMIWDEYLRDLANRQIGFDGQASPTLMVTSGALAGYGRLAVLTCSTCHQRDVALGNDGRCALGCK